MACVIFKDISFNFNSQESEVFENLSLTISSNWKTGITGGSKSLHTSFLKLINKEIEPIRGNITYCENISYFPNFPSDGNVLTIDLIKNLVAPFDDWKKEMKKIIADNDETQRRRYFELVFKYEEADGYTIEENIIEEALKLGLRKEILYKNFKYLTRSEKALMLIIPMFLKKDTFPVLNDPTEYLDFKSKNCLIKYLSTTNHGFILSSDDQGFLDACINHVLYFDKNDVQLSRGNFSVLRLQRRLEENYLNGMDHYSNSKIFFNKETILSDKEFGE